MNRKTHLLGYGASTVVLLIGLWWLIDTLRTASAQTPALFWPNLLVSAGLIAAAIVWMTILYRINARIKSENAGDYDWHIDMKDDEDAG